MTYHSLDRLIDLGLYHMHGDPWMAEDMEYVQSAGDSVSLRAAWDELHAIHGQINYRGEIFVVTHAPATRGFGGMSEGSPDSVTIYRIKVRT